MALHKARKEAIDDAVLTDLKVDSSTIDDTQMIGINLFFSPMPDGATPTAAVTTTDSESLGCVEQMDLSTPHRWNKRNREKTPPRNENKLAKLRADESESESDENENENEERDIFNNEALENPLKHINTNSLFCNQK